MEILVPEEFRRLYVVDRENPILKIPNETLRKVSAEAVVPNKKIGFLIDEMMRLMKRANGVGLAAPQVGILQRIIVVHPPDEKPVALVNPKILKAEGSQIGVEGCLSIPGLYGDVDRAEYVEVEAMDRKGREYVYELEGLPARVVQHEIDHLDGVLFIDKVDQATLHWQDPDQFEREI